MHHIKHLLWLLKQTFALAWKGDFKGSKEAFYFFRFHFKYKSKRMDEK